jgi:hypothetical protein
MEKLRRWLLLVAAIALFLSGVFVGRKKTPEKTTEITTVRYERGATVHDTVRVLTPYYVRYTDTVTYTRIVEKPTFVYADTLLLRSVWDDYYLTRKYELDFSNDTTGVFDVDVSIRENRIVSATSRIVPIYRVTTRETVRTGEQRVFAPFVSAGYSTFKIAGVGGGMFYHNIGIEYQLQRKLDTGETGNFLGLKWKF